VSVYEQYTSGEYTTKLPSYSHLSGDARLDARKKKWEDQARLDEQLYRDLCAELRIDPDARKTRKLYNLLCVHMDKDDVVAYGFEEFSVLLEPLR